MIEFYFDDIAYFYEAVEWCQQNLDRSNYWWKPGILSPVSTIQVVNNEDAILFRLSFDAMQCKVSDRPLRDMAGEEVQQVCRG